MTSLRTGWSLAVVTALVTTVLGVFQPWRDVVDYGTGVGEQRVVVLADGSRVTLNTSTRLRVELGAARRSVRMDEGEAFFEVAKDARRPFVVRVAGREVRALGTAFSVRRMPVDGEISVTLVEGRVSVEPVADRSAGGEASLQARVLLPGDRLRTIGATSPGSSEHSITTRVDRPGIEQVTGWRRNEADFDDVALDDALTEMNRYSRLQIVLVGDRTLGQRRISGLFRTGDSQGFARAVAALHGLVVRPGPNRLELAPDR